MSTSERPLRSQEWWDNADNPGMTALYLERYLNYGLTREELQSGRPIIGIAQTGSDLVPCNRHHLELAERVREGIQRRRRRALRVPRPPAPGVGQAADGGPRPQPRLPRPRRAALRLPARRRRAHHGLRQDHARVPHGGGHGQPPGDRPLGRADAERLVRGQAGGLGHGDLGGPAQARGGRDRLRRVHRHGGLLGAERRPLQHDGHGALDEQRWPRRSACRCPAARRSPLPTASAARWPTSPASASWRWSARTSRPARCMTKEAFENAIVVAAARSRRPPTAPSTSTRSPATWAWSSTNEDWHRVGEGVPGLVNMPARRRVPRRGLLPRGRRARGDARAARGRAAARRRPHRVGQDGGREPRGAGVPPEPRRDPAARRPASRRTAAWSCSRGNFFESAVMKTSVVSDEFRGALPLRPRRPRRLRGPGDRLRGARGLPRADRGPEPSRSTSTASS